MRILKLSAIPAAVLGLAVFMPSGASAQVLKCYDHDTGGYEQPETIGGATNCEGSVNTFVENDVSIIGLTTAAKIKRAVELCGLANGPYRRKASGTASATVDPRLDYVTLSFSPPKSGGVSVPASGSDSISDQININPGVTLSVTSDGTSSSNAATFDLIDLSSNEEGDINRPSQIADLPGFDFAYFEKSAGNAAATLICDHRMWFDDGALTYGIAPYTFGHNVNQVTVGWAMGPSGLGSQANADTLCNALNLDVGLANMEQAGTDSDSREKYTGIVAGFYKTLAEQPDPPVNVTSCAPTETAADVGGPIGHAFHCDDSEPAGSVNSCNPGDGALNGGLTGVSIGAVGAGTNFYFGGSGTPTGGSF